MKGGAIGAPSPVALPAESVGEGILVVAEPCGLGGCFVEGLRQVGDEIAPFAVRGGEVGEVEGEAARVEMLGDQAFYPFLVGGLLSRGAVCCGGSEEVPP